MSERCPTCGVPVPFVGLDGPMGDLKAWSDGREVTYCSNGHPQPTQETDPE